MRKKKTTKVVKPKAKPKKARKIETEATPQIPSPEAIEAAAAAMTNVHQAVLQNAMNLIAGLTGAPAVVVLQVMSATMGKIVGLSIKGEVGAVNAFRNKCADAFAQTMIDTAIEGP